MNENNLEYLPPDELNRLVDRIVASGDTVSYFHSQGSPLSPESYKPSKNLLKKLSIEISQLPRQQRTVIKLYRQGIPAKQIAERMKISQLQVRSLKAKAIKTLKKKMAISDTLT